MADLGPPSDQSAVIIRALLPAGLERLRRRSVAEAMPGLPAHLTMLYPFVEPGHLVAGVRRRLAAVASETPPFDFRLARAAEFPDAFYVAVEPAEPFVALQRRLAAAFPAFPIYGADSDFQFVPHVTIAVRSADDDPAFVAARAWASLPRPARAASIEVIARPTDAPWRTIWRVPLGRMPG